MVRLAIEIILFPFAVFGAVIAAKIIADRWFK